ncbi:hypothetical protein M405DRAFT_843139 [Rhizopogon salebrosus TDB-379]|nr:hypothetical protein M405DRAFT_843139 [Rhizopogon salebrosus TDB-379]
MWHTGFYMTDNPFLQDLSATGHKAHRYPVEHLVINHPRVAMGAFHQVFLWDYGMVMISGAEKQCTAVFLKLHSSIIQQLDRFWNTLNIPGFNAYLSLPLFSNLTHSFDIYNLETYAIEGRMLNGIGIGCMVPILFIHDGCAVIGGNTTGMVRMWDVDSAHFMHALEHGDQNKILSVDEHFIITYFHVDAIHDQDKFLITTGVEGNTPSYIQLWQVEDIYAKRNVFMHMSKKTISTTNAAAEREKHSHLLEYSIEHTHVSLTYLRNRLIGAIMTKQVRWPLLELLQKMLPMMPRG